MTAQGRPSPRFVAAMAWRGGRLIWVGTVAMAVLTGLVPLQIFNHQHPGVPERLDG